MKECAENSVFYHRPVLYMYEVFPYSDHGVGDIRLLGLPAIPISNLNLKDVDKPQWYLSPLACPCELQMTKLK